MPYTQLPPWLPQIPEVTDLEHESYRVLFTLLGLAAESKTGIVDIKLRRLSRQVRCTREQAEHALEDLDQRGLIIYHADECVASVAPTLFGREVAPITGPRYATGAICEFRQKAKCMPAGFIDRLQVVFVEELARCYIHLKGRPGQQNADACSAIKDLLRDLGLAAQDRSIETLATSRTASPSNGGAASGADSQYRQGTVSQGRRAGLDGPPALSDSKGAAR